MDAGRRVPVVRRARPGVGRVGGRCPARPGPRLNLAKAEAEEINEAVRGLLAGLSDTGAASPHDLFTTAEQLIDLLNARGRPARAKLIITALEQRRRELEEEA